ncbi:MAG TPA: DUF2259 domain-containing protein [Firmicutes bacterium]|nr:DUF2259 domain-containing protein [Bacillota bacterium]
MKKILLFLFLFSGFCIPRVQANLASQYQFTGFSSDGRYAALEYWGVADGSGFPYIALMIFDFQDNVFPEPLFFKMDQSRDDLGEEAAYGHMRELYHGEIESILQKYCIYRLNRGLIIYQREESDFPVTGLEFKVKEKRISLRFEEYPGEISFYDMFTPSSFKLFTGLEGKERLVYAHTAAQEVHEFKFNYELRQVIVFDKTLMALFTHQIPGFEGPDTVPVILGDIFPVSLSGKETGDDSL